MAAIRAFAAMLGYPDADGLTGRSLSSLLAGYADVQARDCVIALKAAAGTVAAWCHVDGYHPQTVVSHALLTRVTDPLLLISLTDVTDPVWATKA